MRALLQASTTVKHPVRKHLSRLNFIIIIVISFAIFTAKLRVSLNGQQAA